MHRLGRDQAAVCVCTKGGRGGKGGGVGVLPVHTRMSPNRIFMFLINPPSGNVKIKKLIAKHIFECFEKGKGEDSKK